MSNFLFDTHSHIDLVEDFENLVKQIEEKRIYTIAVTNLPVLFQNLSQKLDSKFIKAALGFHPELIEKYQKYIPDMWKLLPSAKYVGEVGLDFKVSIKSKSLQISFFEELINRCNQQGGKILTIHSRRSAETVVDIIGKDFNGKFILHWYSGDLKTLNLAIDNGAYISVNYAMINSHSGQRIIQNVPMERLLIESDAPFIKVEDYSFGTLGVNKIIEKLASLNQKNYDFILDQLYFNFRRLLI